MPTLSIKDVPEKLHRRLKARARRNRRSLNSEVIALLDQATADVEKVNLDNWLARVRELRKQIPFRMTDEDVRRGKEWGRN